MSNLLGHLDPARDVSGAIYGTVVSTATLAGAAEGVTDVREIAVTVAAAILLYWVAHAYAEVLGGPGGRAPSWSGLARELGAESLMLTGCAVPLAALVAASALGAGTELATTVALLAAAAALCGWGILAARRAHASAVVQVLSGLGFGLAGVAIVALKTLVRH